MNKELNKLITEKTSLEHNRMQDMSFYMEKIFSLVSSRDYDNLRLMKSNKLGSAMIDIAEEYASTQNGCVKNFTPPQLKLTQVG